VLGVEACQPGRHPRSAKLGVAGLGQPQEMVGMQGLAGDAVRGGREPLGRVLADGFKHLVTQLARRLFGRHDQAGRDQLGQGLSSPESAVVGLAADDLSRLEVATASENTHPGNTLRAVGCSSS
jgi:hypothetical protein